jgi:hypothetical protein
MIEGFQEILQLQKISPIYPWYSLKEKKESQQENNKEWVTANAVKDMSKMFRQKHYSNVTKNELQKCEIDDCQCKKHLGAIYFAM